MGMFQSSVNQMFSMVGVLTQLSPELRSQAEMRRNKDTLMRQRDLLENARQTAGEGFNEEVYNDITKRLSDIDKQLFELDPTSETLKRYEDSSGITEKRNTVTTPTATAETIERGDFDDIVQEELDTEARDTAWEERKKVLKGEPTAQQIQMQEERKAQEAIVAEQERLRKSRLATLGISDEPKPNYGVRSIENYGRID